MVLVFMCNRFFFRTAFGWAFNIPKRAWTCRCLAVFAYLCACAGHTSSRAGHRAKSSPGAGEAGGHVGGRSKRKGPPRVEQKAAKRGVRSDFHSFNDAIWIFYIDYIYTSTYILYTEYYLVYINSNTCTLSHYLSATTSFVSLLGWKNQDEHWVYYY